jgi:hypothetical protein
MSSIIRWILSNNEGLEYGGRKEKLITQSSMNAQSFKEDYKNKIR